VNGACLDTGAQSSVIGLRLAMDFCSTPASSLNQSRMKNSYRFSLYKQESLGCIKVCFPAMGDEVELNEAWLEMIRPLEICNSLYDSIFGWIWSQIRTQYG
jgi:hypothetical protein